MGKQKTTQKKPSKTKTASHSPAAKTSKAKTASSKPTGSINRETYMAKIQGILKASKAPMSNGDIRKSLGVFSGGGPAPAGDIRPGTDWGKVVRAMLRTKDGPFHQTGTETAEGKMRYVYSLASHKPRKK
jgi:hypothetical protein